MDASVDKLNIRQAMRQRRRSLGVAARAAASERVCAQLLDRIDRGPCAVYLAGPDEIDLDPAIVQFAARGIELVAPRWDGIVYRMARLHGLSAADLQTGPMHIREPRNDEWVDPATVAHWIVPGLAFTRDGRRLGYGGGWYDRLLAAAAPQAVKLGVAYDFQLLNWLPAEPHDIRLDSVVF